MSLREVVAKRQNSRRGSKNGTKTNGDFHRTLNGNSQHAFLVRKKANQSFYRKLWTRWNVSVI